MYRFVLEDLKAWKVKYNRKPLLLNGARQVGKTWLMEEFAKSYENSVYVYLYNNPEVCEVFRKDSNVKRIISDLGFIYSTKIDENTLIIIDEIQEEPEALASLKRFCEVLPQYHIVCAGSLVGLCLHKGQNFPVGKVDLINVYPLTFKEFLIANGLEKYKDAIERLDFDIISRFKTEWQDMFLKYILIGGMPEAVKTYIDTNNIALVQKAQDSIIDTYDRDFTKHTYTLQLDRIRNVWKNIPVLLAKDNKKFIYNNLGEGARARDYEFALSWLIDYGLINKVSRVTQPSSPLKFHCDTKAFKVYLNDIGLLSRMYNLKGKDIINKDLLVNFRGALCEQLVAQEFRALNNLDYCYYTNKNNQGEVDFIIDTDDGIVPVEVKATINLKAQSLKVYMEKFKPKYGLRISMADYKVTNNVIDIPFCFVSEIRNIYNIK